MKHKHADLMLQYAKDAMETDRPWERWEWCHGDGPWKQAVRSPHWLEEFSYRRKPKTININGFEVPEPLRSLDGIWCVYYVVLGSSTPDLSGRVYFFSQEDIPWIASYLDKGLVHATREAAELHAKALLSFTQTDQDQ